MRGGVTPPIKPKCVSFQTSALIFTPYNRPFALPHRPSTSTPTAAPWVTSLPPSATSRATWPFSSKPFASVRGRGSSSLFHLLGVVGRVGVEIQKV